MANLEAAKKCNHKRTIPKNFDQSLQKKRDKLAELKGKMPWTKNQKTLRDVKASEPKTDKQKAARRERIKRTPCNGTKEEGGATGEGQESRASDRTCRGD